MERTVGQASAGAAGGTRPVNGQRASHQCATASRSPSVPGTVINCAPSGRSRASRPTGSEIAGALTRHGLTVSLKAVKSGGDTVAHVINRRVTETGANLLVMGAFSHSWLRHRLFGGVTSAMMKDLRVPAIMSR